MFLSRKEAVMYGLAYRLPNNSADGNFVITEDGKEILLIDPCSDLDPMDAKKLAGKIMLALEFWENHGRFKDAAKG